MRFVHPVKNLKSRLTVVITALVFISGVLLALAALTLAEREMAGLVGDREYALLSSAAGHLERDLDAKRTLLRAIGEGAQLDGLAAPGAVQSYLERHATLREQFFNVVAFDPSGKLVASLVDRRQIGTLSVADRPYFTQTVNAREGIVSQPFRSKLSGRPVVLLTEPLYDATGQLVCILAGGIDLGQPSFLGQLEPLKPGRSGYLFLLAPDGTILHHPDARRILRKVSEEPGGVMPTTQRALAGAEGWSRARTKAGVDALIGYKRVQSTGWIVGIVYPAAEAFAPLIALRREAMLPTTLLALLAGLLGWLAIHRLLRPLETLRTLIARVERGEADIDVLDLSRRDEVGALSRAFHSLTRLRARADEEMARLARTDSLTGLYNRRMFEGELDKALLRANRTASRVAVAYLDIDRFKQINDTHGHATGDLVLIEFARRLRATVRVTDTVARLAGDEFVVLFEHLSSSEELAALGRKIVEAMRPRFLADSVDLAVTTSVGLAVAAPGIGRDALLRQADEALYAAKAAGRDGYRVVPPPPLDAAGTLVP
ncbi:sensor domain-containing diguanylate cyclase [Pseudoduganella armeniaca]|uniref:Sensor domain-containing diguanylate cyclase n=1 Tax=Pseudoduganella armeniaca TaxID=2072590 RepID=A0A2R4CBS1_9BURK|nr:GGDEF domain-containing protein [Pseudoduganella armeniaca]AVR97012.1 sensor domain-containing diguanylate cyclase [Pseudoduganella armeniaca]